MEKFTTHTGVAAPLPVQDVDTDQITPVRFCSGVDKSNLDAALFCDWRTDATFVLNQPAFRDSSVLVAESNFGCGSSREWAVWSLQAYGFRAVLAPSFGDIFFGNAFKNGLLLVQLDQSAIDQLFKEIESNPGMEITVDLENQQVRAASLEFGFTVDPSQRERLLSGKDDIDVTMDFLADIEAYEGRRRPTLPTARRVGALPGAGGRS